MSRSWTLHRLGLRQNLQQKHAGAWPTTGCGSATVTHIINLLMHIHTDALGM